MNRDFENFPTLEQMIASIKKFEKTEWPKFSDKENIEDFIIKVENIITEEIGIIFNFCKPVEPKDFSLKIFRVRGLDSIKNKELFTEHSYPPPSITKIGRCNFPEKPVFYCSSDPMTALLEVVRQDNYDEKKFCISTWEIIDTGEKFLLETFLQSKLHPDNPFQEFASVQLGQLNEPFENKLEVDKINAMAKFMNYIDSQFISDKEYSLSATLAHRRLYHQSNYCTDILIYPSFRSDLKSVNMAINPNFVDNHMRLKRLYIIELDNYNPTNGKFSITFSKYGEIHKNTIFWKNLKENDPVFSKYIDEDFKSYMANTML